MKLLIDIGNTKTSIALAGQKKIKRRYFIHTAKKQITTKALRRLLGSHIRSIDKIVIVSVVPKFFTLIRKTLTVIMPGVPVLVVGRNIKVPIKIKYKDPKEVGQDRLVVAYAASKKYGTPVVIVDFGTAVTFDFVNKKGDYEGGLIFPGLRLGLRSLAENAALLPHIELKNVKGLIGKDTRDSMNKGLVIGYAAVCEGVIARFVKIYGRRLKVVCTGGDSNLISKYAPSLKSVNKDLIIEGLLDLSM